MASNEYERMFEHDHDGITEYDNPLPGWWSWIFILSVVFSIFYTMYYQIGVGPSVYEKYDTEVVRHLEKQLSSLGEIKPDDATIMRLMSEKGEMIAAVGGMFRSNCGQCHESDGGGIKGLGPNLTDDYWKNVKTPADIIKVISKGVSGTAMQSWENRFREPQIILLATYVASLRGTTPAAPKEPEGTKIDPWPEPEPVTDGADSS